MDKFTDAANAWKWFKFIKISNVSQIIEESDQSINQTYIFNLFRKEFTEDLEMVGFPLEYKNTTETSNDVNWMLLLISLKSERICLLNTESHENDDKIRREFLDSFVTKIKDGFSMFFSQIKISGSMIELITNSDTTFHWRVFLFAVLKLTFLKRQMPSYLDFQFSSQEKISLCYEMLNFLLFPRPKSFICAETMISQEEQRQTTGSASSKQESSVHINNNTQSICIVPCSEVISNSQVTLQVPSVNGDIYFPIKSIDSTLATIQILDSQNSHSFPLTDAVSNNNGIPNPFDIIPDRISNPPSNVVNPTKPSNITVDHITPSHVHTNPTTPIDVIPSTSNFNNVTIESSPVSNVPKTSNTSKVTSVQDIQYLLSKRPDFSEKIRNILYSKELTKIEKKTEMNQLWKQLKVGNNS